jgi:ubiquinone/menaquinone biosynthesis C-methylase UbiE
MNGRLMRLQCPACRGGRLATRGHVVCLACGVQYPLVEGSIIDFVGGRVTTRVDPALYDHGIDDRWATATYDRVRRCIGGCWPEALGDVLEIGCGTGSFSRVMLARDPMDHIVLTDLSVDMLRICHGHLERLGLASHVPLTLATYSATEPCFRDASFDTCIGIQVLHHVADVPGFLASLLRVLKPGGRAVFLEPNLLFHRALAMAVADVLALLLARDAGPVKDLQPLLNWIAQQRQAQMHQGDTGFLATLEDKHMFAGEAFCQAALRLGFSSARAWPAAADPGATSFVNGLLRQLDVDSGQRPELLPLLTEFATSHLAQLDGNDLAQSYVFWLEKTQASPAPSHRAAERDALSPAPRAGLGAPRDNLLARWFIEVILETSGDDITVVLDGWCLLTEDVKWIRVRIDGRSRDAPVWYPRPDVHRACNQTGSYAAWNSLCCGVRARLAFDGAGGQGGLLSFAMQAVLMDDALINMPLPSGIQFGQRFRLEC